MPMARSRAVGNAPGLALKIRPRHPQHISPDDLPNVVVLEAALDHAHGEQRPVGPRQARLGVRGGLGSGGQSCSQRAPGSANTDPPLARLGTLAANRIR